MAKSPQNHLEKDVTVFSLSIQKIKTTVFFLLFLFLPTQLGKHFWPTFAFVLGQRVDYLSPTLYVTDILVFLCILISIKNLKKTPYLLVGIMTLILSIGVFVSKDPLAGWYGIVKLLEFIFLGFSLKRFFQEDRRNVVLLSTSLSIEIIFESLLAILQFFLQRSVGGVFYWFGERTFSGSTPGIANVSLYHELVLRPYATFSHPNVLAAYLLLSMLIILSAFPQVSKKMKILFSSSLAFGTVALLLSLSRVAILIWIVVCLGIFMWYLYIKIKSKKIILFIPAIIFVLFFLLVYSPLGERFSQTNLFDESITSRIELMQASLSMWQSHILFGVGFDNFLTNLPIVISQNGQTALFQPVHNIFLLILSETGVLGLIFFFWFLLQAIKHAASRLQTSSSSDKTHIIFLITAFTSVLFLGMEDHYFFTLQQGQLLLTLILSLLFV